MRTERPELLWRIMNVTEFKRTLLLCGGCICDAAPFRRPRGGFGRCPRGHSLLGAGFRLAVALSAIPLLYPWLLASVSLGMLGCCSLLTTWLVTPWVFFRSVMALRATGNAQTSPAETMSPRAPGTARNGFRGHPVLQETVSEGTRHCKK